MSKKLVVFYSFEGNTKFVAEAIARSAGCDLLELKPEKEIKTRGFMKYFWGGRQVIMKKKPKLLPLGKKPEGYDLLFIGTPVWASNFAPALRTFLSENRLKGKKIALFCCYGGSPGEALENMKKELAGNSIIGEIGFKEPKNSGESRKKAEEWARKMISGAGL